MVIQVSAARESPALAGFYRLQGSKSDFERLGHSKTLRLDHHTAFRHLLTGQEAECQLQSLKVSHQPSTPLRLTVALCSVAEDRILDAETAADHSPSQQATSIAVDKPFTL